MPLIEINGAQIYYETFGAARADRAPIMLIHGSTGTGQSNWRLVAPLLAREYHVIVPDCRGHGKSSNPRHSYSFKEMADDVAALVRALGYPRAHIIGHSNGGNVALVTLLEHPDIVQTAIPQAANAYVSPDLIEKEPDIFDPDRVARQAPAWRDDMIALHGATHGENYWRELLRLTVAEIIAAPNYTPADLARVTRPTLVIQGAQDRVNAPMRHAQFIAQHIPDAEQWIPAGVGHNVHDEMLFAWIERVLDFLARRGDDANDALERVKRARYDDRTMIFDLQAEQNHETIKLAGQVLCAEQADVATATLKQFSPRIESQDVKILLDDATPCAIVKRAVIDLNREPRPLAERLSQARLGESLRILDTRGDWVRVRLDADGYLGWVRAYTLHRCEAPAARAWQAQCNALVQGELVPAFSTPDCTGSYVGKIPFGVTLPLIDQGETSVAVRLPDDRVWWLARDAILTRRPAPDAAGIARTLELVRRFVGVPYLWGGRSPFGFDCSGLAQTFWNFLGVAIPRDADQQFNTGTPIAQPQPGDLIYFGDEPTDDPQKPFAPITHVAIALGDNQFIHANASAWGISYNSFDPAAPNYGAWLKEHIAGYRRFA